MDRRGGGSAKKDPVSCWIWSKGACSTATIEFGSEDNTRNRVCDKGLTVGTVELMGLFCSTVTEMVGIVTGNVKSGLLS